MELGRRVKHQEKMVAHKSQKEFALYERDYRGKSITVNNRGHGG
jgi:hypothetical protein